MESAAVLRTFHCTVSPLRSGFERPGVVSMHNAAWLISTKRQAGAVVMCSKSSDVAVVDKTNGSVEKNTSTSSTFPTGFEELVLGVCDETQIAELKMKIGGFEMHLKRNIKSTEAMIPVASPTVAPPIPSEPMTGSAPVAPPKPPKPSKKPNPFANVSGKPNKLAALEASGASGYVLVSSPTVGLFRKSRIVKGKKQPILCKEGDMVKEGQTLCYLDQFGALLPVKSDVDGEIIKILFNDGEALGYSDPLIAILPSFHP